jgi:hypothetical protein
VDNPPDDQLLSSMFTMPKWRKSIHSSPLYAIYNLATALSDNAVAPADEKRGH